MHERLDLFNIQLFRERLSQKNARDDPERYGGWFCVHSSSSRKFERMAREAMDVCLLVLKENSKNRFDSYSVGNSVLIISHITFLDFRVHIFSENLSRNSCIRPWRWRAARSKKQTVASSGFSPALHREVMVSQPRLHLFVPNINSNRAFSRHVKFRFPFVTCIFQWIICVHSGQFSLLSQNSIMH